MMITTVQLRQRLTPFGGTLVSGVRRVFGRNICALELASLLRGKACSDRPLDAGLPDIRYLNDAQWASDEERTAHILPVVAALWNWPNWTPAFQAQFTEHLILRLTKEVLPIAYRAIGREDAAKQLEEVNSLADINTAAIAIATRTADAASRAAEAAAKATQSAMQLSTAIAAICKAIPFAASRSRQTDEETTILPRACQVIIECAQIA